VTVAYGKQFQDAKAQQALQQRVMFDHWKEARQRCRTDLIYLCTKVLGYKDVNEAVHGKMVDTLQKFTGGVDKGERITLKGCDYAPNVEMWRLPGKRKKLILIPRGHLKSTVATIAHTIQWIINYQDIRILISTATQGQAIKFISEMKAHFQQNEAFRYLFPEFCPQGKNVKEFGTQESFTVPARQLARKEPTVSICTVGSVVAGGHFDVHKNDDLVDKENVRTPDQIANVNSHFGFLWPLVETSSIPPHHGWVDVIGTRYDFSDLYGIILDAQAGLPEDLKPYQELVQSAAPNYPEGPTLWPDRVPIESLRSIEKDPTQGPGVLASQYLMNPIPASSGLVDNEKQIIFTPKDVIQKLYAYLTLHVTVDLAGMEPSTNRQSDNDYTAINVHGFGQDGRLYVLDIKHGRFTPFEVIDMLFDLTAKHPRLIDIKIEKEAHARVLMAFLKREMVKRQRFLPIVEIRRDNRTSKQQRIKGLQPWFRNGSIAFAEDLPCRLNLINEVLRFPKFAHDDILDTIADAMQNRDGGVVSDVLPNESQMIQLPIRPPQAESLGPAFWGEEEMADICDVTGW
jgi:predicted phage terminase large subunit-like protein